MLRCEWLLAAYQSRRLVGHVDAELVRSDQIEGDIAEGWSV